jgi:hypothetical protein
MPSPSGRNAAELYLPQNFPRATSLAAAYDAMPGSPPPGYLGRACRWLRENGFDASEIVEFVCAMDDGGEAAEDRSATSERVHNAMEAAAHMTAEEAKHTNERFPGTDELMTGAARGERFSKTRLASRASEEVRAMDEVLAHVRKIGRGPLGYA